MKKLLAISLLALCAGAAQLLRREDLDSLSDWARSRL